MKHLIATVSFFCLVGGTAWGQTATSSTNSGYAELTIIKEINVPAREAGVLDELNFKEGDMVEKGAVIGVIEKTDAELAQTITKYEYFAAKKQAESRLRVEAAAMAHDVAKEELRSSIEANDKTKGVISKSELRKQNMEVERAKKQAELAVHEISIAHFDARAKHGACKRAESALERRQIISRINGVVVKKNKHEGEWVQPGETVMRIVQMDRLRVESSIDGGKYARHEMLNRPVRITVTLTGGGKETVEGRIVYASSIVELNHFTVRAEIDNRKITTSDGSTTWLLTPGLKATMELSGAAGGNDVLNLPQFGAVGN